MEDKKGYNPEEIIIRLQRGERIAATGRPHKTGSSLQKGAARNGTLVSILGPSPERDPLQGGRCPKLDALRRRGGPSGRVSPRAAASATPAGRPFLPARPSAEGTPFCDCGRLRTRTTWAPSSTYGRMRRRARSDSLPRRRAVAPEAMRTGSGGRRAGISACRPVGTSPRPSTSSKARRFGFTWHMDGFPLVQGEPHRPIALVVGSEGGAA